MAVFKTIITLWIVRNEDGRLVFFRDRPHKVQGTYVSVGRKKGFRADGRWLSPTDEEGTPIEVITKDDFPSVRWENNEPSVMLLTPTVGNGGALK